MRITITGGAGYVGSTLAEQLLAAGHEVRVLDRLLFGQQAVADSLVAMGAELQVGDVRDPDDRAAALADADALVHLAAIVGDPACARDPEGSEETNVDATLALAGEAGRAGLERIVFASTCSNYGRMADPTVALDETAPLAPVSLYASQKVKVEQALLGGDLPATCLRFATVYGAGRRMRFDLTVNEFTRDLWAGRPLEVFGEQFWRPYVHVADAARSVALVVSQPAEAVVGQVFNVGHSDENYTKQHLVEHITGRLGRGEVTYVRRDEDPRDYRVSFDRIRDRLGYVPLLRVPDGIDEIVEGLEAERFGDPFSPAHSNIGVPA
jgi:nucleoside-diphosphate-sugar epimerase